MRIDRYNNFANNHQQSAAGRIGTVSLPNYNDYHFNTKKSSAMSDEKFREAIIEQARKDQSVGKFQTDSNGFKNLVKNYVSVVSPDRKNIIAKGLTAVFKNNTPQPKTLNMIDYLFGKVKYNKEQADLSYAEFYDGNGEMVASYSNGKWISYGTNAENARETELCTIYTQAWNRAAKDSPMTTSK